MDRILGTSRIEYRDTVETADIQKIRHIVASSSFFNNEEIEVAVELAAERLARGFESGYHFIFAELDRQTVGYACYGPILGTQSSFDFYWIAVDEEFRNQKIGKGLLEMTEAAIKHMNGHRIYVETSSRPQYEPTRAFYSNNGYRLEATLKDFYAPGDSKHIYLKEI